MSLVIVETVAEQPLTDEVLDAATQYIAPCVQARNGAWLYSLLSSDRHRMICIYDAPDAESIRDAYRRGGLASSRAWAGYVVEPEGIAPQRNVASLIVFEGTYPPLSDDDWNESSSKILSCYAERGIEWIQTYLSLDRTRMVCELNAPDLESVREVQRRLNIPFDRVWSARVLSP